jgi:membrane-associated phospholipid phosphatase
MGGLQRETSARARRGSVKVGTLAGLFATAILLDGWVAETCFRSIESGQVKAFIGGMRCWGEAATLVVITLGMIVIRPGRWIEPICVLIFCLVCGSTVDVIKPLVGRFRPTEGPLADDVGVWDAWRTGAGRNSSFPSGHTATAFCFARGLSHVYPALRPLCLLAAGGTAFSRVAEQRHYVSDCVASAVLGWYGAGLMFGLIPILSRRLAHARRLAARYHRQVVGAITASSPRWPERRVAGRRTLPTARSRTVPAFD